MQFFPWVFAIATGLVEFFAKYFTRRVACLAAFVALIASLIVILYSAVTLLINSLYYVPAGQDFYLWLKFLLPANAKLCMSTLVANKLAHQAFSFQAKAAEIAAIKC